MTTAHNYKNLLAQMDAKIRYRDTWICGLLFAPPESAAGKSLMQCLQAWYQRSEENLDFFCVGYLDNPLHDGDQPLSLDSNQGQATSPFHYSPSAFEEIKTHIEQLSGWEYTGSPALILANATQDSGTYQFEGYHLRTRLQFEDMIVLDLDRVISDGSYESVSHLLENICRATDKLTLSAFQESEKTEDQSNWKNIFVKTLGIFLKVMKSSVPLKACHFLAGAHYLNLLNGLAP